MRSRQAQTTPTPTAEPKFPGRVPQEQNPGQAPGTDTANQSQPDLAVAQRVVLYEEDPNDPQGKRYVGSAVWRTETISPGTGLRRNSSAGATQKYAEALTSERLFSWHASLFPTGRSGMPRITVGAWRPLTSAQCRLCPVRWGASGFILRRQRRIGLSVRCRLFLSGLKGRMELIPC